jgi:hypothetical protein
MAQVPMHQLILETVTDNRGMGVEKETTRASLRFAAAESSGSGNCLGNGGSAQPTRNRVQLQNRLEALLQ